MKNLITFITAVLLFNNCFAQAPAATDTIYKRRAPLYVYKIDGEPKEYYNVNTTSIKHYSIESMEIVKDRKLIGSLYGAKGKYGVINVTLKKGTQLLNRDEMLKKFRLTKKGSSLPIYIDSSLVATTSNDSTLFAVNALKNAKIKKDKETGNSYIMINTRSAREEAGSANGNVTTETTTVTKKVMQVGPGGTLIPKN